MIIIDTMIEVTLISIGFIIGFITTTFSHKIGSRTVENAYKNFISPTPPNDSLDKNKAYPNTSENDDEPFPYYNFQEYQDYVETNGLEYQDTPEEEEPDNSEFEDLLNGK
tara:strand:+ start:159 stop:488 length:330 start_codon:yes stop_codon:yes gene_type:complete